jgi:predicted nucleic acid-binding protein
VDLPDTLRWGVLTGEAKLRGETLPSVDALLAATALNRQLTLVTRNTKDFQRCGVTLLNPWETTRAPS